MKGTIVGNLGGDAEVRTTPAGKTVTNFSVADTVGWGDKKKTQWVRCNLWGDRGNKLSEYLKKGQQVVVFGEVSLNEYTAKDGTVKHNLECNCDDIRLVGKRNDSGGAAPAAAPAQGEVSFNDDDIPF